MPLDLDPCYEPPIYLRQPWLMLAWSTWRTVKLPEPEDEQFRLSDNDFVRLDWWRQDGTDRVAILAPGLPGHSGSSYVRGMVRCLTDEGWDVVAWNFRGCSGEPNDLRRSYNAADSKDLREIVDHLADHHCHDYETIGLVGFSLGGGIVLKYLGEKPKPHPKVRAAVAISPPCDLVQTVEVWNAGFVNKRIVQPLSLRSMRRKAEEKVKLGRLEPAVLASLQRARTILDADHFVLAPLNGFDAGGPQYWTEASSRRTLREIDLPTRIISARDDPMLAPTSYPLEEAEFSEFVSFDVTQHGSHVGFVPKCNKRYYWSEVRARDFLDEHT